VLILLPPSEAKSGRRRGRPADPATWSFPELLPTRSVVARALEQVSASTDAPTLLGVSPNLLDDIARNLVLGTAPATPAAEVYTGVLYDALALATLDRASRRRATQRIVVISALYGALRLTDRIAPYRLAMGVDLPGIGPLARAWKPALSEVLPAAAGSGVVVDCRSAAYVAAWPPGGALADRWAQIRVPGASHMAKHTRGLVARYLCGIPTAPRTVPAVARALAPSFEVTAHPPTGVGRAWVLDVRAPVSGR
jgi:cytoplasmic iron level regulating protein YaaA (DUF328/UPF0246 family)